MRYGYARVSTTDQDLNLQTAELAQANCDGIFEEKISGTIRNRPQLDSMLSKLAEGDVVVVTKLDRLFRSSQDMLNLLAKWDEVGVGFECLHQPQLNTTDKSPMAKFLREIIAAVAELEKSLILDRTANGRRAAVKKGVVFGRRPKLSKAQQKHALELVNSGMETPSVAKIMGVSRHTIWRLVKAAA